MGGRDCNEFTAGSGREGISAWPGNDEEVHREESRVEFKKAMEKGEMRGRGRQQKGDGRRKKEEGGRRKGVVGTEKEAGREEKEVEYLRCARSHASAPDLEESAKRGSRKLLEKTI